MPFDLELLKKEVSRKAIHMSGFIIPLAYYFFIPKDYMILILGLGVVVAGSLELIRISGHRLFPALLLRGHEKGGTIAGYFYALVSSFMAVLLFDKSIAVAAILFLDLGDGLVGIAGAILSMYEGADRAKIRAYSAVKQKICFRSVKDELVYSITHYKSPLLMVAMFITCSFIGFAFYPVLALPVIVAGALGAVVADAFPWRFANFTLDDNLSIPILSGILMSLTALLL